MRKSFLLALVGLAAIGASSVRAEAVNDRQAAMALLVKEKWIDAEKAFQALTTANPYDGRIWYHLGLSASHAGDYKTAQVALDKAIDLGVDGWGNALANAHIEAAACALALGQKDRALAHLAIVHGPMARDVPKASKDARFAPLGADPRYLIITGQMDYKSLDRVKGWRTDLAYFKDLSEKRHAHLFHNMTESQWLKATSDLNSNIPKMSDAEVITAFMRLASLIGDGHTTLFPPITGAMAMHLLPIWPYAMGKYWLIAAAAPEHADLVGATILRVNGNEARTDAKSLTSMLPHDNAMTPLWLGSYAMQFAEGATAAYGKPSNDVMLDVLMADGSKRSVKLRGEPVRRDPTSRWAPQGWPTLADKAPLPLWLARNQEAFWFEDIKEMDAVYAQVNQVNDSPERSYGEFAQKLGEHLRASGARRLILDLRLNNGGNAALNWSLVRQIVLTQNVDHEGGLFVITGRRTFSASQSLITMLEQQTHPIFVGEPASSRPAFYGESRPFTLPWSGLSGSISNEWHQGWYNWLDSRPWIAPDIATELTAEDLKAGRDPAFEAIAAYVAAH
jgi:hypothetical protein